MIENTSARNPLVHLAMGFPGSDSFTNYVTDMEAAGQAQLVNSEMLPREGSDGYATVGVKVVDDSGEDLFVKVALPDGWSKRPTDHSMWSEVVDELGRKRIAVFYKGAFYDRRAFASVETVESYLRGCVYHNRDVVTDDQWCTPTAVSEAATGLAEQAAKEAVEAEGFAATQGGGDRDDYWAKRATECHAETDRYRAIADQYAAI